MSGIVSTYRKLLELPLSVLVKNNPIPAQPIARASTQYQSNLFFMFCLIPLKLTS